MPTAKELGENLVAKCEVYRLAMTCPTELLGQSGETLFPLSSYSAPGF